MISYIEKYNKLIRCRLAIKIFSDSLRFHNLLLPRYRNQAYDDLTSNKKIAKIKYIFEASKDHKFAN